MSALTVRFACWYWNFWWTRIIGLYMGPIVALNVFGLMHLSITWPWEIL